MSELADSGSAVETADSTAEASGGSAGGETAAEPGEGTPASPPESDGYGYYIGGPELEAEIAKTQEPQAGTEVANSGGSGEAAAAGGAKAGEDSDSKAGGDAKAGAGQDAAAESTVEASGGSAGGETAAEPGEGTPASPPESDGYGYYIGGPELEKDITTHKMQNGSAASDTEPGENGPTATGRLASGSSLAESQALSTDAPETKEIASIATPYGPALQGTSEAAISARAGVEAGRPLYRLGKTNQSEAGEAQFWALEHPATPGFASRHGIPPENASGYNFVEKGHLREGVPFITREAPPVGTNLGEGIEVVVPPGGARLDGFSHLGEEGLEP
jgi:hypothetical protein